MSREALFKILFKMQSINKIVSLPEIIMRRLIELRGEYFILIYEVFI